MSRAHQVCQVCHKQFPPSKILPATLLRDSLNEDLSKKIEGWNDSSFICLGDLKKAHARLLENVVEQAEWEPPDPEPTFGEKIADRIAAFGGSWTFIFLSVFILAGWILLNGKDRESFDPYPFILLNLVLSSIAALQAPVIMMSQNRQSQWDRRRAREDYLVNLKAELEVRTLNEKLDSLMSHQWQQLMEIQKIQLDLLQKSEKT